MKILLADDHAFLRKGLRAILSEAYPYAIMKEVSNGVDLIKMSMKEHWDIIVSDISMPGKSGVEVLKEIKENGSTVPFIILSVHLPELFAVRCFKEGAAAYLTKESAPELLVTAINHVLSTNTKFITPNVAILLASVYENNMEGAAYENLSKREFEVFKLLAAGKSGTEIAEIFQISIGSVSTYRKRLLEKMNLQTNADIVKYAIEHNLL